MYKSWKLCYNKNAREIKNIKGMIEMTIKFPTFRLTDLAYIIVWLF